MLVCNRESSEGHGDVIIGPVWYLCGLIYTQFLAFSLLLPERWYVDEKSSWCIWSKMQIFLVFQLPPLLSLTQDEFLDTWSHETKVCPASQLHKNSFYTWPPVSACSVLRSKGENRVRSPGHWVFSVWRQGCQDVGINDGRFLRICEWLMIDWLAFRRFLNVSWPQVWGMPGLLCSELWWRSIEPGTQEVWVLDLPLSELTVISVFLFLLS